MDDLTMKALAARAEEHMRDLVDLQTLQLLRRVETVGDLLAAKHYGLSTSVSPLAFAAAWQNN